MFSFPFFPPSVSVYAVRQKHILRHFNISVSPSGNRSWPQPSPPRRTSRTRSPKSVQNASIVWREKVWNHDTPSPSEWNLHVLSRTQTQSCTVIFSTLFISCREGAFHGKSANVAPVSPWLSSHVFRYTQTRARTPPMFRNSEKLPDLFSC